MAITNLQQARQMYQTGQRVAKTLNVKGQPHMLAYITPGEAQTLENLGGQKTMTKGGIPAYPPGMGDPNYDGSGKGTYSGSGGNQSTARERAIERNQTQRTPTKTTTTTTGPTNIHGDGGGTTPYTYIGGKKYDVTPKTRAERERATLKQQILNQTKLGGNRIDKFGNTKKSLFRQGSGLGSLLMSGLGMLMGIPGLGLITGGFNRLKGGLDTLNTNIGDFRERTTGYRTQAEYEAARNQRRLQSRLDKLYSRKNLGKGYSQKNINMLEAMGLSPTTPQNQDNARGSNLRNILNNDVNNLDLEQGDLNNIESLVAAAQVPQKTNFNPNDLSTAFTTNMGQSRMTPEMEKFYTEQMMKQNPSLYDELNPVEIAPSYELRNDGSFRPYKYNYNPEEQGIMGIDVGYPSNDLIADASAPGNNFLYNTGNPYKDNLYDSEGNYDPYGIKGEPEPEVKEIAIG